MAIFAQQTPAAATTTNAVINSCIDSSYTHLSLPASLLLGIPSFFLSSACMQRRSGKAVAHIAPPLGPVRMGSDPEKASSRLSQKTIGVTNRIWLFLIIFIVLMLITKQFMPPEQEDPRHRLLHTDLKPKNYLNVTDGSIIPFAFCPALGPGDDLAAKYDPLSLSKTRLHMGSGARVQRVITRALSGLPVTISVIGGSSKYSIPPKHAPGIHRYQTHQGTTDGSYLLHAILPILGVTSYRSMAI